MMRRWMLLMLLAVLTLASTGARAVSPCAGVPYSFVNGTIAQAPQVNANFIALQNCITAITAGAGAPNGIAVFDASGNLTVPGPLLYVGGLLIQDGSGTGYIRDTTGVDLGYGSTNVVTVSATGVTDSLGFAAGGEIDGGNIGDATYVTPTYCPWATLNLSTDQTACIKNAVAAACAAGKGGNNAGYLIFARAAYYIKLGNITIPKACAGLIIAGQGNGGGGGNSVVSDTWFVSDNNCTGPLFYWYNDATQNYVYGGGLINASFYNQTLLGDRYGSQSCKYPLIKEQFGEQMLFDNIYAWVPYQLFQFISGLQPRAHNVVMDQVLQDSPGAIECFGSGAHPDATGQQTRQDGCTIQDVFAGGAPVQALHASAVGISWHGFAASPRINRVAFEGFKSLIKTDCTVPFGYTQPLEIGACPSFLICYDCEAEIGGGNGVDMQDVQSINFYFLYVHCFGPGGFGGGCNNAVQYNDGTFLATASLAIFGGQIDSANHNGLQFRSATSTIQGVRLFNNNLSSTGGADLYIITPLTGEAKNGHVITGNTFCQDVSGNLFAEAPVVIQSGNDWIDVSHNNFHGCASNVTDASGGTHNVLTPNVNF